MKNPAALKYAQVFVIAMLCIVVDQWTKQLAETHLASQRAGHFSHNIVLTVGPEDDGKTVGAFLGEEFGAHNSDAEMAQILAGVTDDGAVHVTIDSPVDIKNIYSPSHDVEIHREGDRQAEQRVRLAAEQHVLGDREVRDQVDLLVDRADARGLGCGR